MLADTSDGEEKRDVALMAAGTLAFMVNRNGDYVSSIFPDGSSLQHFPFKTGLLNLENILKTYHDCVTMENDSTLDVALDFIMKNIRRRMIIVIVTDLEGIAGLSDSLLRQMVLIHDVLLINVRVYSVTSGTYLPPFVTESRKLKKLEEKKKMELQAVCDLKLKKYGIAMVTAARVDRIDEALIGLLEKHKLRK